MATLDMVMPACASAAIGLHTCSVYVHVPFCMRAPPCPAPESAGAPPNCLEAQWAQACRPGCLQSATQRQPQHSFSSHQQRWWASWLFSSGPLESFPAVADTRPLLSAALRMVCCCACSSPCLRPQPRRRLPPRLPRAARRHLPRRKR